jgi:hypothetical protein
VGIHLFIYNDRMKIFLSLIILFSASIQAAEWKKIDDRDGVVIYSKKESNSKLMAFKGNTIVNMNLGKLLAVLRDVQTANEWDKNLRLKRTIEDISDIQAHTYSIVRMPWPFKDRDLVLDNKLYFDDKTKELVVIGNSIDRPDYPTFKKYIRARINYAEVRFTPINENQVRISLQAHVDPMGSIPTWIVNWVQKDMPYDFIKNLEKFSARYQGTPNKTVLKMMQQQEEALKKVVTLQSNE